MQTTLSSSIGQTILPFEEGKYTGQVNVSILKDTKTPAIYIRVIGERISLECFQGQYSSSLKKIFGATLIKDRQELADLTPIFGSKATVARYGSCSPEDEAKIKGRIENDSKRPFSGDVFTGFAIVDRAKDKIIGRISLGSGYEPGESQSGLIIEESYRGKGYGKEATCLAAALAFVFYQNKFSVGDGAEKAPVTRFTATALDTNKESIKFITQFGLKCERSLKAEENYSDEPRSLYSVKGSEVNQLLEKFIDTSKLVVNI